jgi:hypothetical protein
MSKVKIEGNASGTGTLTIAAPNTNTDRTLTLPDGAGEILTNASEIISAPAFAADTNGTQSLPNITTTVANYGSVDFDTNSCYDSSTSRFTPNVEGYYYVSGCLFFASSSAGVVNSLSIYKNGSRVVAGDQNSDGTARCSFCSALVYLNGTTDYVDMRAYQSSGGNLNIGESSAYNISQFSAFMARRA